MKQTRIEIEPLERLLGTYTEAFGDFQRLLLEENAKYNLTRITEPQQIRVRHWVDSLSALPILDELADQQGGNLTLLDAGSGAGIPGLPLAIVRPKWQIVSLEATEKKVRFQQMVCEQLNLQNVTVLHGRSEELANDAGYRAHFDAVTARAVGALPILAELTIAFLRQGGRAIYWKGPGYQQELAGAEIAVDKMGAVVEQVQTCALPIADNEIVDMNLIVCLKLKPTPAGYPRVFGVIKSHPLLSKLKRK